MSLDDLQVLAEESRLIRRPNGSPIQLGIDLALSVEGLRVPSLIEHLDRLARLVFVFLVVFSPIVHWELIVSVRVDAVLCVEYSSEYFSPDHSISIVHRADDLHACSSLGFHRLIHCIVDNTSRWRHSIERNKAKVDDVSIDTRMKQATNRYFNICLVIYPWVIVITKTGKERRRIGEISMDWRCYRFSSRYGHQDWFGRWNSLLSHLYSRRHHHLCTVRVQILSVLSFFSSYSSSSSSSLFRLIHQRNLTNGKEANDLTGSPSIQRTRSLYSYHLLSINAVIREDSI